MLTGSGSRKVYEGLDSDSDEDFNHPNYNNLEIAESGTLFQIISTYLAY